MTVVTSARPDLDAYTTATRFTPAELVTELRELLGSRLVAYLGGVKETRAVREWATGTRSIQDPEVVERLRLAYRVTRLITMRDTSGVAQAWFQGLNPQLEDRSPAMVLRTGVVDEVGSSVLAAARAFAAAG